MGIRILIFEDNEKLRKSLCLLVEGEKDYTVVGDYPNCENVIKIVKETSPDLVIMDINMPIVNGIEGTKLIKENFPDVNIIMHTVFDDDENLFKSLCAGANGYILKSASLVHLISAIEDAEKGGAPMSPEIARKVLNSFHKKSKYDLTPQERKVLSLLVVGYSYKMIASELFVSINTVRTHIKNIYLKLHVNCGREAVTLALKDKII